MPKVLAIEDEAPILENILETLEIEGYEVVGAANGAIGIKCAREHAPDIIICDIMMPELDGYGVLLELRNDPRTVSTPFIFLTARADRAAMRQGMELGADDFLTKPFTTGELVSAIHTRLEKHAAVLRDYEERMQTLQHAVVHSLPHELRTPLTGILGCAEFMMLDAEMLDAKKVTHMAEIIQRSAKRLQRLTENYLLYAQVEMMAVNKERQQMLSKESCDYAGDLVAQMAYMRAEILQPPRSADMQVDTTNANVRAPQTMINKITEELVDNALKFSQPGQKVLVEAAPVDGVYRLRVQDFGRGMTPEQIKSVGLYMQFERKLYEQQGLGIGLILAKRMSELLGGTLIVESEIEKGTTVTASLPLVK